MGVWKLNFFGHVIFVTFGSPLRRSKMRPRGSKTPPRAPQEAQEAPKSAPGGPKRASREPKSRSRGLKTRSRALKSFPRRPQGFSEALGQAAVFGKMKKLKAYVHKVFPKHLVRQLFSEKWKKFKAWLQKASKTLKIAHIDESQRPCHNSQNEKRRAGGGDPPWGSQSAARPVGVEPSVSDK